MKTKILAVLFLAVVFISCGKKLYSETQDKVYDFNSMEIPPTYPGGASALYQLLADSISIPKEALKKNIEGTIKVSFTVEKDGSLTDVVADNKLGYGLEEEAVRVITISKLWSPGIINNSPVRSRYTIPIQFSTN